MKRTKKAAEESGAPIPIFLASKSLYPFISQEMRDGPLAPILYSYGDSAAIGYAAETLPEVCDIWLRAREANVLNDQQKARAQNDIVYARLAPGVLEELQTLNPKDINGQRQAKHHQFLTDDVGHPALAQHLHTVISFLRASTTWAQFKSLLDRAFPKGDIQLSLLISDDE